MSQSLEGIESNRGKLYTVVDEEKQAGEKQQQQSEAIKVGRV